ncbi:MAG TPA: TatD family hydrolase [Armatimonadota bacterium]|jgi:TatD DNase family protein
MIDAHSHLNDARLLPHTDAVLERMQEAGVTATLVVGYDLPSSQEALALARRYPTLLRAAIGVHPHESKDLDAATLDILSTLAQAPEVVAFGEIGLDYHYDHSPRDVQREAFHRQLALAAELALPIIIHEREAADDVLRILDEEDGWARGGTWHCCDLPPEVATTVAQRLFIGIAGWITFPKAENIRAVAQAVPLERLLLETDAPYLTPVPFRGKTNEPAYVRYTAHAVATLKDIPIERVETVTSRNVLEAFPRWLVSLPEGHAGKE